MALEHVSPEQGRVKNNYLSEGNRFVNGAVGKVENLAHAVSLHFMYYNFGRIHETLRVTPAMEAEISDHVWSWEEIAELTD
jgi:hypothetical protein